MQHLVGHCFSETNISVLHDLGIEPINLEAFDDYKSYQFHLSENVHKVDLLEIRLVQQEEPYLLKNSLKNFSPFIASFEQTFSKKNPIYMVDLIRPTSELPKILRDFFVIRKNSDIWAIVLKFKIHKSGIRHCSEIDYQGKQAFLFHMGPSCFDIIFIN